jgi:hypothetical protein
LYLEIPVGVKVKMLMAAAVEANWPFAAAITTAHVRVAVAGRLQSPRARETASVEG